jgi:preprotein translocase subunit Sss1
MISPQIGQIAFRIAFMMVGVSLVLIFILTPGSAEYWVSVLTLGLGVVFMGIIFVLVRVFR